MQTVLKSEGNTLTCGPQPCTKTYTVINEKLCTVDTFPQAEVMNAAKPIDFDPINIDIMNPDGDYDPNDPLSNMMAYVDDSDLYFQPIFKEADEVGRLFVFFFLFFFFGFACDWH